MEKMHLAAAVASVLFLINILLYVYQPLGDNFYVIGDAMVAILSFLAVLAGLYAYKTHGFRSIQGRAILLLTMGVFFWFLGEATWGIYEVVLGVEKPIASIADVFWLAGYPLFLAGIYYVYRTASIMLGKKKLAFYAAAVIIICSLLLYFAVPSLADSSITLEERLATGGYVVGDMLLLVALIFVILCLWGSRFAKAWSVILLAIAISTMADVYFMNFSGIYETGSLIDILWNLDYILMAFGFLYHRETVRGIMTEATELKKKKGAEK